MLGDSVVIYNEKTCMFFCGWDRRHVKITVNDTAGAMWSERLEDAKVGRNLSHMSDVARMLGARVMSETKARQIDAMRIYRERGKTMRLMEVAGNA